MTDKPKCPQAIMCLSDKMGVFPINACMKVMPGEKIPKAEDYPSCFVTEYIPRHSIDALLDACEAMIEASEWFGRTAHVSVGLVEKLDAAIQEFRPDA